MNRYLIQFYLLWASFLGIFASPSRAEAPKATARLLMEAGRASPQGKLRVFAPKSC